MSRYSFVSWCWWNVFDDTILQPPHKLDYPHYEGCIELDNLNEHIISLYNFKRTFNLNTTEVQPCRRYDINTEVFHSSVISIIMDSCLFRSRRITLWLNWWFFSNSWSLLHFLEKILSVGRIHIYGNLSPLANSLDVIIPRHNSWTNVFTSFIK